MDTSPEYIEMCDKAVEIQYAHTEYDDGDFYYNKELGETSVSEYSIVFGSRLRMFNFKNDVFLPRQDQLQEMFEGWKSNPVALIQNFNHWFDYETNEFPSLEQLWLAFVMQEKYGKIWNGKDWRKQ